MTRIQVRQGKGFLAHPSSMQWVLVVKWPGHGAKLSPACSSEVKNAWTYTSIPPYVFMVWCLIKQRIHLSWHGS